MSYRRVGGLHFVRIGRFGFSWFWSRKKIATPTLSEAAYARACRRSLNLARLRGDVTF